MKKHRPTVARVVKTTSSKARIIVPETVAEALGAEEVPLYTPEPAQELPPAEFELKVNVDSDDFRNALEEAGCVLCTAPMVAGVCQRCVLNETHSRTLWRMGATDKVLRDILSGIRTHHPSGYTHRNNIALGLIRLAVAKNEALQQLGAVVFERTRMPLPYQPAIEHHLQEEAVIEKIGRAVAVARGGELAIYAVPSRAVRAHAIRLMDEKFPDGISRRYMREVHYKFVPNDGVVRVLVISGRADVQLRGYKHVIFHIDYPDAY